MPPPWQWKLKMQDPLGHVLLSGLQPKNNNTEIPINSSAKYPAKRRSRAESQQGSRELDLSVSTLSKCIVSSSSLGMVQMDSTPRLAGEKEVGRNPGCDTEAAAHVLLPYLSLKCLIVRLCGKELSKLHSDVVSRQHAWMRQSIFCSPVPLV